MTEKNETENETEIVSETKKETKKETKSESTKLKALSSIKKIEMLFHQKLLKEKNGSYANSDGNAEQY